MSASSANIIIPTEVRQPLGLPTILEDPNIAGVIVGLVAPHQFGETFHMYEQRHVAAGHYQGSPASAFFGQAGEWSEQWMEQVILSKLNILLRSDEVPPIDPLPKARLKKISMAEKLDDRIAYQHMCNEDLSKGVGPGMQTKKSFSVLTAKYWMK